MRSTSLDDEKRECLRWPGTVSTSSETGKSTVVYIQFCEGEHVATGGLLRNDCPCALQPSGVMLVKQFKFNATMNTGPPTGNSGSQSPKSRNLNFSASLGYTTEASAEEMPRALNRVPCFSYVAEVLNAG